eukprot:6509706-Heterocapsa_arctica.AAC.1
MNQAERMQKSREKLKICPFGVLGAHLTEQGNLVSNGPVPTIETVVLDPAGLRYIEQDGPKNAGGASQEIYRWLGIADDKAFPDYVKKNITKPPQAAL